MTDLERRILDRCIEEGDCWVWQGACAGGERGGPCVNWGGKTKRVRRMLWEALNGPIKPRLVVAATCGNRKCVSPSCAVCVSNKKSKQMAAARGAFSGADKIRKATAANRARSWITDAVVEQIKSARTAKEANAATGVSVSWAKAIRAGRGRVSFGNPFAGLGG